MVDGPKLRPQDFARGGQGGTSIRRVGDVPSLRSLPTVRDVGTEASVNAMLSLAQDSFRLQNLSGDMFRKHMDEVKADQAIEAQHVYTNSLVAINEAVQQVRQTAENPHEIPALTDEAYTKTVSGIMSNSDNLSKYQRELLRDKFDAARFNTAQSAISFQNQMVNVERQTKIAEIFQATEGLLFENPGDLHQRLSELGESLAEAGLNATQVDSVLQQQRSTLAKAAFRGMMEQSPSNAIGAIKAGYFDGLVSKAELSDLQKHAKSKIRSASTKTTFETLLAENQFNERLKADPLSVTNDEIRQAAQQFGWKASSIRKALQTRSKAALEAESKQATMDKVLMAVSGDGGLNPFNKEDVDAVNTFYEELVQPEYAAALSSGQTDLALTAASQLVERTGVLPTGLKQTTLMQFRNGTPEQQAAAADLIFRLEEQAPDVSFGLSARDSARAKAVKETMLYADNPVEAIQRVDQKMAMADSMVKQRRAEAEESFDWSKKEKSFRKKLDDITTVYEGGSAKKAQIDPTVQFDIEVGMKAAYLDYLTFNPEDEDGAEEYAIKQMVNQGFGVTNVGGTPRVVRNPIERYSPKLFTDENPYQYIYDDLDKSIKEKIGPDTKYELVPTPMTERQLSAGQKPVYSVIVLDEYGIPDVNFDMLYYQAPEVSPESVQERAKQKLEAERDDILREDYRSTPDPARF